MWQHSQVLRTLRARGDVWDVAPGVTGLRGDAGALFSALEQYISAACLGETHDEWRVPPAIDFATLARADYFASLPQWLTLASHLSGRDDVLLRVAEHPEPAVAGRDAGAPPRLPPHPAGCHHVLPGP